MPKKHKRASNAAQAKNAKQKSDQFKQLQREYAEYKRALNKERQATARAKDKEYKSILKLAKNAGIYTPKSTTELTPYRRKRAREVKRDFGHYLDNKKYFFLPAGKEARRKIIERAQSLEIATSRTGIFFPKEGHTKASIKADKKRGEYFVERRGKTKTGINKGRIYRDVTPLASVDELDRERDRLRRAAKLLGPLGPGDRLSFKVVENGVEGYSHSTFMDIEALIKYLDSYPKSIPARVNFYRHIKLEKSTVKEWFAMHPTRSPGKAMRQDLRYRIRRK